MSSTYHRITTFTTVEHAAVVNVMEMQLNSHLLLVRKFTREGEVGGEMHSTRFNFLKLLLLLHHSLSHPITYRDSWGWMDGIDWN